MASVTGLRLAGLVDVPCPVISPENDMPTLVPLVDPTNSIEPAHRTRSVDATSEGVCTFEFEFKAMYEQHSSRLAAVALRYLKNGADAEDAVQDAFLAAYRKRNAFEGTSSLGTWVHRILINVCLMKLRSKARRPASSLELLPLDARENQQSVTSFTEGHHEHEALLAELRRQVREAMCRLPEPHRTILQLRDFEGFSTAQTVELLGISEDAVKTRLCRARRALRKQLT